MKKELLKDIKTLITAIILAFGILTVSAWNGPISTPPNGNGYAPINTTATSQTKSGSLWASGFFTTGGGYFGGDVGIGTQAPEARLDVRNGSCYYKLQSDGFYTNCVLNTPTALTISSDTANYNIATALGNPTSAKNVILTINSGVKVYSTSTSQPALDTGSLPSGSTVKIVNNGSIIGAGGVGGKGGFAYTAVPPPYAGAGGVAINAYVPITLDNTNGYVFGGGGGGGGGGGCGASLAGGGGGGGAGSLGGGGGAKGDGAGAAPGSAGGTTGGAGGSGDGPGTPCGVGGNGGEYGAAGQDGQAVWNGGTSGTGAAAGKAINLNGNTTTWLGGNNSTQVKGAVQ